MVRKMCGVKLADRINTTKLMEILGLKDTIVETVRQGSLRWLGHVLRKSDDECVKQAWNFEVEDIRGRGRPKMSWEGMMEKQSRKVGVNFEDVNDRVKWRSCTKSWKECQ